ncbi:MAG: hypothetical protein GY928_23240 [Colwellia sp.]|nr:hypothetical protein [Colwellia sp.]
MKTHLFNTLEVSMIAMTRRDSKLVMDAFFETVEDLGMELQSVFKQKGLVNMRLVGGDEEDFNTIRELVRTAVQDSKFKEE